MLNKEQSAKHKVQCTEHKVQSTKHGVRFKVQNTKYKVPVKVMGSISSNDNDRNAWDHVAIQLQYILNY